MDYFAPIRDKGSVWLNAPGIWRDFGSAQPYQTSLTETQLVLPLSNELGSQVKDQSRWQGSHNKHKKFPYRPTRDVSLLFGHASYFCIFHSVVLFIVVYCNQTPACNCTRN